MRLDALTLTHVRMPLARPFVTAHGRLDAREAILLTLQTEGLTVWGECSAGAVPGYTSETLAGAWRWLQEHLAPRWLGRPLPEPAEFLEAMRSELRAHPMALAGFEMALWDARGQLRGQSLAEMLGAARKTVPAGVALGIQDGLDALRQRAETLFAQGYRRLKIKIRPGYDRLPVETLRRAFPDWPLQVDANGAYDRETASSLIALDDFDLLLIEQPFAADDWETHRWLQARMRTPLCLDETILTAEDARRALDEGVCRAINVKPARVGGLQAARAIHDAAMDGLLWVGGMLETGLGRAASLALAALPAFTLPADLSASARYYPRDITQERFCLNPDGSLSVPEGPGLGVHVDAAALRVFTLRQLTVKRH